jgi:hypothetical protein
MSSKLLSLAAFITLFSVSAVNANDWCQVDDRSENSCCEVECKLYSHLTFSADLLYWRALQGGLDDCFCGQGIKTQWDPGLRLGLEISPLCEGMDIAAYWTYFDNKSNQGNRDDAIDSFAHWRLNYETFDFLFGYKFNKNDFNYTPYAGLSVVYIDEKLNAIFSDCACTGVISDSITEQHHHERFRGIGPKFGVKGDYTIGCNFGLYADLGVGFLYGKFNIHANDFQTIPNPTDSGAFCSSRHINACQAVVDAAVGIQWKYSFCNSMEALVKLGLEHHRYFNQTRLGSYGDLCFDGATLSVGIQF